MNIPTANGTTFSGTTGGVGSISGGSALKTFIGIDKLGSVGGTSQNLKDFA